MDPFAPALPIDATEFPRGAYDPFPSFPIACRIWSGYGDLATAALPDDARVVAIDGFHGADWDSFADGLLTSLAKTKPSRRVTVIQMRDCLASSNEIFARCEPFLGGDDRVFGTHYPFGPEMFFDAAKISKCRITASCARSEPRTSADPCSLLLFIGVGAALIELYDALWYMDVPKDEVQRRGRAGLRNLGDGCMSPHDFGRFYKRAYFIEWPALGRHKQRILHLIDVFVDGQAAEMPMALPGRNFRNALSELVQVPFRVRPWFSPGVWGGQFMKGHMGLDPSAKNFAWSFELIAPENGVVLEDPQAKRIECSFDFAMFNDAVAIQGTEVFRQFGYEWPIRFDYLDTIDGGNLSTQCHPRPQFMRRNFGETYTQDETYYISKCKPGARVLLGLQRAIDRSALQKKFQDSFDSGTAIEDFDGIVHSVPSQPHDLFLIPNGTIHCSGAGNLVLEISSTPYIFTFKMYDYVRKDLDGKMRPMNIDRGVGNMRLQRDANFVDSNYVVRSPSLLQEPTSRSKTQLWKEFVLYDRPETFYVIHRIEFASIYEGCTCGRALAINLVEGRQVIVEKKTPEFVAKLNHLETMIIPAAVGEFVVRNVDAGLGGGSNTAKLVKAFVRPGVGVVSAVNLPNDDVE